MIWKAVSIMVVICLCQYSAPLAITIKGNAPQITISNPRIPDNIRSLIETEMNKTMAAFFDSTLAMARTNLQGFNKQPQLARGFANANTYSTHSATLAGYPNYKMFALGSGFMLGIQAPSANPAYYDRIIRDIGDKGDLYAGLGAGYTLMNIGLNAKFITPGLYVNVKFGALDLDVQELKYDFLVWGLGANYRWLEPKNFNGLLKWQGVSLGTGIYYQKNDIVFTITGEDIENDVPFRDAVVSSAASPLERQAYTGAMDQLGFTQRYPNATMTMTPEFAMGLNVKTTTIPLDAGTAVDILFGVLKFNAGMGIDLNLGNCDIGLSGVTEMETEPENPDSPVTISNADVTIDGASSNGPSFVRFRLMAGIGLGLGPVKVDVPFIYYPASGMALGISGLVVF